MDYERYFQIRAKKIEAARERRKQEWLREYFKEIAKSEAAKERAKQIWLRKYAPAK